MAIIQTIEWDDGSGDKIYLNSDASEGNQTVTVSSDANTGSTRTKTVTFTSDVGNISETITITQVGGTRHTVTFTPSFYDEIDYSYYSISNLSNAYTGSSSNTYCTINLTRGSRAETWMYFGFNVSSIPSDAFIESVSCVVKSNANTGNSSVIASRTLQMFSGTTSKGSTKNIPTNSTTQTFSGESWTRAELDDIRIKVYGRRGTSQTSTNHNLQFYGATLTVTYII